MKKILLLIILIFSFGIKITIAQDGCWKTESNMDVPRAVLSACSVKGVIYAIGGSLDAYSSTSVVEAYNAAKNMWTIKASLPQELCGLTASVVNDKIYVIGGSTSLLGTGYVVDSVYEYNPVSNSWTRKSNIPTPIAYASADVVDGKIYIIGGCNFKLNAAYNSVYEYNPTSDTWKKKSDMPTARFLASATAVDGKIYVFGGASNLTGEAFSTLEIYDPSTDTWIVKGSMPIRRSTHASSAVNGNIYIFSGGLKAGSVYKDILEYNPTSDTWKSRASIPTGRVGPAACSIGGKIYVLGGMNISNVRLSTVEEYDPALDTTNIVSVKDGSNSEIPTTFKLEQNYPNPFNPTTSIEYRVASTEYVTLKVYDVLGREVATLVNEEKPAGTYEIKWNAENLSCGAYFYQLKAGDFVQTKKLILMK